MTKKKEPKPDKNEKPRVNPALEGFNIEINSFGEIKTNFDIDRINAFLNQNVEDKKLRDRPDLPEVKRKPRPDDAGA